MSTDKSHIFRLKVEVPTNTEIFTDDTAVIIANDGRKLSGTIVGLKEKQETPTGQIGKTTKYFAKQFRALGLPLGDSFSRQKFLALGSIYAILSFSFGIGSFFVRGWQLGVIRNLTRRIPIVAPSVQSLTDAGTYISKGIVLIFTRFLYDLPKYILLVIFGYEFIEILFDCTFWFINYQFGEEKRWLFAYVKEEIALDLSTSLLVQLLFFVLYSFIVTPTYKIQSIKYAINGNWSIFFDTKELINSFKIYRSQPRSTIQAYLWDIFVTSIGSFITIILSIIPFLGIFVALFYRFAFLHWPKGYGYGTLGRKLVEKKLISLDNQSKNVNIRPTENNLSMV